MAGTAHLVQTCSRRLAEFLREVDETDLVWLAEIRDEAARMFGRCGAAPPPSRRLARPWGQRGGRPRMSNPYLGLLQPWPAGGPGWGGCGRYLSGPRGPLPPFCRGSVGRAP